MAIDCANTMLRVTAPGSRLHDLTAVSFMAWVNLDAAAGPAGLLAINVGATAVRKGLGLMDNGGALELVMYVQHTVESAMAFAALPSIGSWHHICGRWDSSEDSGQPDVFIDGVDVTTSRTTPTGSALEDGGSVTVAVWPMLLAGLFVDAKLADAAIFGRRLTDREIASVAGGRLRANLLAPLWHVTLEGANGMVNGGEVGLQDTTGGGNHIDTIINPPAHFRDPPLHWADGVEVTPVSRRGTRNSRPTMNVLPGAKLATLRRGGR